MSVVSYRTFMTPISYVRDSRVLLAVASATTHVGRTCAKVLRCVCAGRSPVARVLEGNASRGRGRVQRVSETVRVGAFVGGVRNGKAFQVSTPGGDSHTFDSFECAIHALAPTCEYCGVRVIGHGVEADGRFYCCAHCASMAGVEGVSDRA